MYAWQVTRCESLDRSSGDWHRNCYPPRHRTRIKQRQKLSWCGRNVSPVAMGHRVECVRCLFASKRSSARKTEREGMNGMVQPTWVTFWMLSNQEGKLEQAATTNARLSAEDVHIITGDRNRKIAGAKNISGLIFILKQATSYQHVGGFSPV